MKFTFKIFLYLSILFLTLSSIGGYLLWHHQQKIIMEQAQIRAESILNMIIITRQWISDNRERIKPVPAIATKELSKYADKMANFKFHITSNKLINPDNKPDDFEKRAIEQFLKGEKEYKEIEEINGNKTFRYMGPLYINESCLKCHHYQNYKVGDFRGGISLKIPLNDIEEAIYRSNKAFIIYTFIIFASIMMSFIFLMYQLVLKNLKTFKNAVNEISKGNYSFQTNLSTKDEFEDLSKIFDMMSNQILENEKNLKKELFELGEMYNKVLNDVKDKNKQLESISSFKTDILDSISHEVRTPLTKIISYSDILNNKQFVNDVNTREKSIKVIKRNIKLLKELFDNILTLNRLDHQKEFFPTLINLKELLDDILKDFQVNIDDKSLSIIMDTDDFNSYIDVDYFQYVIRNIVSNAIKYNFENGEISIKCKHENKGFLFSVINTGPGIEKAELDSIFKRFFRGSNVKNNISGVGLGLSIIKKIINNHNGTITVKSKVNETTEFSIFVPNN